LLIVPFGPARAGTRIGPVTGNASCYFDGHSMSAEDGSSYLIAVDAEIIDDRGIAAKAVAADELIGAVAGAHILSAVIRRCLPAQPLPNRD
jgi:hypothetical protein